MTDDRQSRIAPPPSVDDVLSSLTDDGRIGQVDFTVALAPDPAPPSAGVDVAANRPQTVRARAESERRAAHLVPALPEPEVEPDEEPIEDVAAEPEPEPVTGEQAVDVARAVEQVAAEVIGRMRTAEEATLRHLDAMELEATRRYELVTAQAELDAELIRLQSRREAHAIVTAARLRAGDLDDLDDLGDDPDDEGHRLSVLGDAVSRVADATDSSLNRGRGDGGAR